MTTKKVDLEQPMLKLSFGYNGDYVLPWADGVAILNLMKESIPIASKYENSKSTWYRKKDNGITALAFSPTQQAELLMNPAED